MVLFLLTAVRDLRVSGLVDGVDVGRMMSRALRTSSRTPQMVSAGLIVEGNVHFDRAPTLALVNGEDWATHLGNVRGGVRGACGGGRVNCVRETCLLNELVIGRRK